MNAGELRFETVPVARPDDTNVIIGQSHFIKTVEDLHEVLVGSGVPMRFGIGFCEASGARLVRRSGNDDELTEAAAHLALQIGAGHCFVVLLRNGYPVNILNQIKAVPEVCSIYCATANEVEVVIAATAHGRAVAAIVDGEPPVGIEQVTDVAARHTLLRDLGYKL